ncbi:unnamed protein product [Toxocara canis]|uniref:Secreted protein n=1 Tax=Toxocara canis TaxID=6265 RepID=A0A183TZX4_TOXCA|nr:unnamed protein product [Toxocara canis]
MVGWMVVMVMCLQKEDDREDDVPLGGRENPIKRYHRGSTTKQRSAMKSSSTSSFAFSQINSSRQRTLP